LIPELRHLVHRERRRVALQHPRKLLCERDCAKRRFAFGLSRLQVAIEPAVFRALDARRRRFHIVLGVEVRSRCIGRSARLDDGELASIPERLERSEARVQPEEAVEIERRVAGRPGRASDRNRRTRAVILCVAVRDDHAQAVHCAALEDRDQLLGPSSRSGGKRGPGEE
jgi:hypothetical protein